ncbi:hypothetical protein IKQ38_02575 [Candidatus Saccharibacteria bacterium]|nr:hypothetical protein [Candidatus Saccharibacteria bacterium]
MKRKAAIAINIIIVILEIVSIVIRLNVRQALGIEYYTMDSNILSLIISSILAYYLIKGGKISKWVSVAKYVAVCMLAVTILVTVFILSPMIENGFYIFMFTDQMLYNHTLCPILSLVSFLLLEKHNLIKKDIWWPIGATLLYAFVLIILNLCRVVDGPYPFLQVYNQSLIATFGWAVLILGGTAGISAGIYALRKNK